MGKNFQKKETLKVRANDEIRYDEARVIYRAKNDSVSRDDFNKVMKVTEAKEFAESVGLDLIEINANAKPPILKVYDYTKYVWEMKQLEKKKKRNGNDLKEIQLSVNISQHDMLTKVNHAKEFLEKGAKVKLVLTMKGRELGRREESSKTFYEFLVLMGENLSYDSLPKDEGNKLVAILKKKK